MVAFKTVKPFVVNYNKFPIYVLLSLIKKRVGDLIDDGAAGKSTS